MKLIFSWWCKLDLIFLNILLKFYQKVFFWLSNWFTSCIDILMMQTFANLWNTLTKSYQYFFSHFRLKDGKRYPWSLEVTSSLILFPQAANQTIYARHASKVDEGRYTCILRNDTHKMEHHTQLKVLGKHENQIIPSFIDCFSMKNFQFSIFSSFSR